MSGGEEELEFAVRERHINGEQKHEDESEHEGPFTCAGWEERRSEILR